MHRFSDDAIFLQASVRAIATDHSLETAQFLSSTRWKKFLHTESNLFISKYTHLKTMRLLA